MNGSESSNTVRCHYTHDANQFATIITVYWNIHCYLAPDSYGYTTRWQARVFWLLPTRLTVRWCQNCLRLGRRWLYSRVVCKCENMSADHTILFNWCNIILFCDKTVYFHSLKKVKKDFQRRLKKLKRILMFCFLAKVTSPNSLDKIRTQLEDFRWRSKRN